MHLPKKCVQHAKQPSNLRCPIGPGNCSYSLTGGGVTVRMDLDFDSPQQDMSNDTLVFLGFPECLCQVLIHAFTMPIVGIAIKVHCIIMRHLSPV
jgi:hypothetical protein